MQQLTHELRKSAAAMGAKAFGIADLDRIRKDVPNLLERVGGDYARAVVCGMRLQSAALEGVTDKPTPIYFHAYRQLNYQLDTIACILADMLQDHGHRALAVPASQIIGRDPMVGHISHRLLGQAAGIGYRGRSGLLIHPEHGAQMRYVSVLTDARLPANEPAAGSCGSCRACRTACPAGAIGERHEDFDMAACFGKLTDFTHLPFIGQHICGVCVKACGGRHGTRASD